MNGITKSKCTKLLSALLAVLMIVAMLPTTAFAWSVEEGTKCTSTYGDHYVGSDGEMFYSKPTTTAIFYNDDGSFYVKTEISIMCTALRAVCPSTTATPTIPPAERTASIFRTCPSLLSSEL